MTHGDIPLLVAIMPADQKKFYCDTKPSNLTVEIIGNFISDVLEGKLEPSYKSEEIPEKNYGPLTIVVGKQFEELVKDPTKDVFIKYYAPWCGHCKTLAPIWEQLAEFYRDENDVVIAKLDATANEAYGMKVRGYPTLMFYPKGNKDGIEYEGQKDLESLKNYVSENADSLKQRTVEL